MGRLSGMVRSMGLLMESILEDGEDPMVISNDYINVLCQVTSTAGTLSFETGEWDLLPVCKLYFSGSYRSLRWGQQTE